MTAFPSAEDYVRAVQDPLRSFHTPSLQQAVFATHPILQIPMPASGSAAVVFKATVDGTPQALRFFVQEDASERRRYDALGRHFVTHGLGDCVAGTRWVNEAIAVNGRRWPMVQMEWIEGRTLDAYVGHLVDHCDVGALHVLAGRWRSQVQRLQTADFAHGDLQHGNVLVDTAATLRLVDFDGSWITDFTDTTEWPAPKETGNVNYQPSGRVWGRWMDTFPGLVIYTALLALSRRPDAWRTFYSGENMLFSADDFVRPGATPTWELLAEITDPQVAQAVERLRACCRPGWTADGPMEELLGRERSTPVEDRPPAPTGFRIVGTAPKQWWDPSAEEEPMPAPPPRTEPQPGDAAGFDTAEPSGGFFGVGTNGQQETRPAPAARPSRTPAAAGIGVAVALVVALLIAVAGGEPGGVVAGAVVTGLLAFFIARAALDQGRQ
jgi:hypothetical protein